MQLFLSAKIDAFVIPNKSNSQHDVYKFLKIIYIRRVDSLIY